MEFGEVVRRRRMVREYADRPVDPAVVERMLTHAVRAPSAGFTQGWAFLVLDTPETVARFWEVTSPISAEPRPESAWLRGMRTAPVVIVPLAHKDAYLDRYAEPDKGWTDRDEARWLAPYWQIDTGMASLLILLTAVDEGLGACFFGIPPTRVGAFRQEYGVPEDHAPIGAITVGHPATPATRVDPEERGNRATGSPSRRGRRTDVVHRGGWRR